MHRPRDGHPEAPPGNRRWKGRSALNAHPASAADILGRRPNILVLMCDEMRFPPIYESEEVARFRAEHLTTQELLRRHGMDFERHYAASCACTPSRASLYTGQYPSLHGVAETTGAAKEAFDPDTFWLDPNSLPDDDPSLGLHRQSWTGVEYWSVLQPNHIETVIARLKDGSVWKYSRYFDNPQYWSSPGDPNDPPPGTTVEDVTTRELGKPGDEAGSRLVPFRRTVKTTPVPDEFEMYNVTADPLELSNLAGNPDHAAEQAELAALLQEQVARKRLTPQSGTVPGQPS